uniref:HAD family hydrolase n=1 Tax=Acetatifactor sp. TaxID=1872090 RepID=UPI0040579E53
MVKNIIFDIGNVLADFAWREFLANKGFDEAMVERIANASVLSEIWREYDRGVWTEEEILEAFVKNDSGIERELHLAFDDFTGMVTMRAYTIPWMKELKEKGYSVLYLSNFPRKAEEDCPDSLAFIPYMDGGILSYRDKLIKPDTAIYELLLKRFDLVAEECVFLDDTLVNVEAAEKVGIHGVHFQSKEQAEAELQKLGIDV